MEQSDLLLDGLILAVNSGNIKFEKIEPYFYRAVHSAITFNLSFKEDKLGFGTQRDYFLQILLSESKINEKLFYSQTHNDEIGNRKVKGLYYCVVQNNNSILSTAIYKINKLNRK